MNLRLLNYLEEIINRTGKSPTLQEIRKALNTSSVASLYRDLNLLEAEGYIRRGKGWRGISLGKKYEEEISVLMRIPLLGWVAAGNPIEAILIPEYLSVPPEMIPGGKNYFALRVRGDSMIDENILDGDQIIIRAANIAENGQIVVALIDGCEATIKTFRQNGGTVELIPANKNFEIIRVAAARVTVQGVLTGLIRRYQ